MINRQRDPDSQDYVRDAFTYLSGLNYSSSNTSATMSFEEVVKTKNAFYQRLSHWLEENMLKMRDPAWKCSTRSVNALVKNINNGNIVVADADDIALLSGTLEYWIYEFPQVIEYYGHTGEFMELVKLLAEYDDSPYLRNSRLRIYKLYTYDVNKVREHLVEDGDAPQKYMNIPLEIRAELAEIGHSFPDTGVLDTMIDHQDVMWKLDCEGLLPLPAPWAFGS